MSVINNFSFFNFLMGSKIIMQSLNLNSNNINNINIELINLTERILLRCKNSSRYDALSNDKILTLSMLENIICEETEHLKLG